MARGARRALPRATITALPLADGGEGTLDALQNALRGRIRRVRVRGPLGAPVTARLLLLPGRTAVVEMAQAAGLLLVPERRRDALRASTFGVGEMIVRAARSGARRILVTLGGSATTDGGAGMAQALGARLLDTRGRELPPGGGALNALTRIDATGLRRYRRLTITGATDVRIPLTGPQGAAAVFAPQKGASPAQVRILAGGLRRLARVIQRDLRVRIAGRPRGGAAGGLGAGLVAFLGARLSSGADLIFDLVGLDRRIGKADLVLTGEGSLDAQTAQGKLVMRVAARARKAGVPVLAFAGRVDLRPAAIRRLGLRDAYAVTPRGMPAARAFRNAGRLVEDRVARALREYSAR